MSTLRRFERQLLQATAKQEEHGVDSSMVGKVIADIQRRVEAEAEAKIQQATSKLEIAETELKQLREKVAQGHEITQQQVQSVRQELTHTQEMLRAANSEVSRLNGEAATLRTQILAEQRERMKVDAKMGAMSEMHDAAKRMVKEMQMTPAPAPNVTIAAPAKGQPVAVKFEIQRNQDGRIVSMVARPTTT